jgi:hypothetical protein
MSNYDAFLNSLLARSELSLLEWAKRGLIKDVERLTPYFIAYLCCPFDANKKGSNEYEEEREKCFNLYKALKNNAMGYADWGFFDAVEWPFHFSECPELSLMTEDEQKEYRKGKFFPEIRTYLYTKDGFMEMMKDREISIDVFGRDALIWRWLDDFYIPLHEQIRKKPPNNAEPPNSIYRLVLGLAMDGFGFDPTTPKQENGVMKSISAALERQGLKSIERETILKHLRIAVEKTGWKPRKS